MLIISQSENAVLNVPVIQNNTPVNVATATDIVVRLTTRNQMGQVIVAPTTYSLNPIPGYGSLTINANNVSLDLVLETQETSNFLPGVYEACIIVKTNDTTFASGSKRTEYRTPNVLRVNPGCNTTDLMP